MLAKINWIKIKNEYISTNISYRKLAEKYSVSFSTLRAKAKAENWVEKKEKQQHKIGTKVAQKTAEKIAEKEVDRITKLLKISDDALEQIELSLTQLTKYVDMFGNVAECDVVDANKLRKLVASIKDMKDVISVSEEDKDRDSHTGVVMLPEVKDSE